jgi:hypothetical protein
VDPPQPVHSYFSIGQIGLESPRAPPQAPAQTRIISHPSQPIVAPPSTEQSRHESFVERFSRMDANTFQAVPLLSFSVAIQSGDPDVCASHDIEQHCRFIDQVVTSLVAELTKIRARTERQIAVVVE